ncbi:MAG TPA: HD domain-containing protein [Ruminococcus sp.]|nr:HD domain-containing protein [Ruminococcus sp.]
MTDRLNKQLSFMLELDKMKNLYRQTYVLHEDRTENDAEHSWHLAVMAFLLEEYFPEPVDLLHVMKMVLLHDVVEIDAGDTYIYDDEGNKTKADREEKAAQRIYGLLPEDQREEFSALWREFEAKETPEARFAGVLDRVQPLLLNYTNNGRAWTEHGIAAQQVKDRNTETVKNSPALGELILSLIDDAQQKGWLK